LEDPDDRIIFKVSPNPTRDVITLLISEALPDEVLVNVYNSEGKKMLSAFVKDNINRIPISRLSRGMYFVEIRLSPKRRKILSVIVN
ncbi:MAG TPA: T9SS type A sorting domain-containing protein, partial [Flavitalea sp.]|nr:T9SS type A sorting domain-containing protein [Flavitalea sp.]